uniref:Uncharacterized protein n=1 Tax=Anguilla anguilla TaxID=7936 RepID=A0A0E9QKT1_ANGAN
MSERPSPFPYLY